MSEGINLKTNEFWGRKSGTIRVVKNNEERIFRQMQWGHGSSGNRKAFNRTKFTPDLPRSWFGKGYKSKRNKI